MRTWTILATGLALLPRTGLAEVKQKDGTEATVAYRISGDPSHQLDGFIAIVDQVVGQQFAGFAGHADETSHGPGKQTR